MFDITPILQKSAVPIFIHIIQLIFFCQCRRLVLFSVLISVGRAKRSLEPRADWTNQTESTWHNRPWMYTHTRRLLWTQWQNTECKASLLRFLLPHLLQGCIRHFKGSQDKTLQLWWAQTGDVKLKCIVWCGLWDQINPHRELRWLTAVTKTTKPVKC